MEFVSIDVTDGVAVLRLDGRLNMVAAPRLKASIDECIDGGGKHVVVDLADVVFMDSSGLGALVGALKTARQAGGDLRIAAPSEQVVMVLQLSNLDRVLTLFDTAGDAYRD